MRCRLRESQIADMIISCHAAKLSAMIGCLATLRPASTPFNGRHLVCSRLFLSTNVKTVMTSSTTADGRILDDPVFTRLRLRGHTNAIPPSGRQSVSRYPGHPCVAMAFLVSPLPSPCVRTSLSPHVCNRSQRRLRVSQPFMLSPTSAPDGYVIAGSVALCVPFFVAAALFGERVARQRRCVRCNGSGLVKSGSKFYRRCPA